MVFALLFRNKMKLNNLLKEHNVKLNDQLSDILVLAIKEHLPNFYLNATCQNWSNYNIARYVCELDLDDITFDKIISHAARISKMWIYS